MTCDTYTTGNIFVGLFVPNQSLSEITSVNLSVPGSYTLTVDDSYLGETAFILGWWDKDESNGISVGDCLGWGQSFQLAKSNTVDVDINRNVTATVSGNVICDAHTTGFIYPFIFAPSAPSGQLSSSCTDLAEPGSYTCYVLDVPIGLPVYVIGTWDADGSGFVPFTFGDYLGWYTGNPLILSIENTGIDIDVSHEYVAQISGTITCPQHTSGNILLGLYDGPDPNTANRIKTSQTYLAAPGTYSLQIYDIKLGIPVWVFGFWDKDGSNSLSPGEYMGAYPGNPITLQQTNTNINFDVCSCIDSDGDNICDGNDNCPDSHLESTIVIGDCDTGVANQYLEDGCTMSDQIAQCEENAKNHRQFVMCVNRLTKNWMNQGLITQKEKRTILLCAAKADIP
jgi:hypothetical protein